MKRERERESFQNAIQFQARRVATILSLELPLHPIPVLIENFEFLKCNSKVYTLIPSLEYCHIKILLREIIFVIFKDTSNIKSVLAI